MTLVRLRTRLAAQGASAARHAAWCAEAQPGTGEGATDCASDENGAALGGAVTETGSRHRENVTVEVARWPFKEPLVTTSTGR